LVDYDDVRRQFVVLSDVRITDRPEFPHRGILLDTSRSFMELDVIKRLIEGMALSKVCFNSSIHQQVEISYFVQLNVLHLHLTDTHSYPVEQKGDLVKEMHEYGAYGSDQIYTQKQLKDLVEFANRKGVRLLPELDQPAHVAHGWDFPGAEDLVVCNGIEPWYDYCYEPPCGQLNPTKDRVFDMLEQIYKEWYDVFKFPQFHLGADEVKFRCWNESETISAYMKQKGWPKTREGFVKLWSEFMDKSVARLKKATPEKTQIVVWSSELTHKEHIKKLDKDEYVIQVWTNSDV